MISRRYVSTDSGVERYWRRLRHFNRPKAAEKGARKFAPKFSLYLEGEVFVTTSSRRSFLFHYVDVSLSLLLSFSLSPLACAAVIDERVALDQRVALKPSVALDQR